LIFTDIIDMIYYYIQEAGDEKETPEHDRARLAGGKKQPEQGVGYSLSARKRAV
jgi:hypothetical protein